MSKIKASRLYIDDDELELVDAAARKGNEETKKRVEQLSDEIDVFIDAEYTVEKDLGLTAEIGYGINPENGQNETLSETELDKYCCTNYRKFIEPVKISLPSDEYEYIVWCYSNYAHTAGTYTPTPSWVRNKSVLITNKKNTTHFRICIRRVDGGSLTDELEKINALLTFSLSRVVQDFGDNERAIMSQKSLTDAFAVTVSGSAVALDDAAKLPIRNLCVRGNTTQLGAPTPDDPVSFEGVGDKGTITITANDEEIEHAVTIATPGGLHGNAVLHDIVTVADGVIVKRFETKIFDGTEDWKQYTGSDGVFYLDGVTPAAIATTAEYSKMVVCTHFGQTTKSELDGTENAVRFQKKTASQRVYLASRKFATVGELKSFLAEQNAAGTPVTVVYPMSKETSIALTAEEIEAYQTLNGHYPYTTVSVDEGEMDVTYVLNSVQHFKKNVVEEDDTEETVENNALPAYFAEEVKETAEGAKKACEKKAFAFILVTDSHYPAAKNWRNTIKNIKALHKAYPVDAVFHLGDMIPGTIEKERSVAYLEEMRNALIDVGAPCYLLMGNHDDNTFFDPKNMTGVITQEEWYAITQRYNDIRVIRDGTNGYYYFDLDTFGIRVVCLHSHLGEGIGQRSSWGYTSEQIEWVRDVALDTDKQVIFFSHMPLTQSFTCYNYNIPGAAEMRTVIEAYKANGGTVVGLFHGHNHWDFIGKANQNGFYEISTACSRDSQATPDKIGYMTDGATAPARKAGTVTEDLWDVVVVQPMEKVVKMIRFGAGDDREFLYQ